MATPSRKSWLVIAAVAAALVALVPPTPHWRQTTSQSCHLCGNRRVTARTIRWWRLESEIVEPVATFPVPDGHVHEWWQYASTFDSSNRRWAFDHASRYSDGRMTWTPAAVPKLEQ